VNGDPASAHLEESDALPKLLSQGLVLDVIEVELGVCNQSIVLLRGGVSTDNETCQGVRSTSHPEDEQPYLGLLCT